MNVLGRSVKLLEQRQKRRTHCLQLFEMRSRQPLQQPLGSRRKRDLNLPAIGQIPTAPHEPRLFKPIEQLDGSVVLYVQMRGQVLDAQHFPRRRALDGQQRLMLLRREAGGPGGGCAEGKKLSQTTLKKEDEDKD